MRTISYPSLKELIKLEANGFLEEDGISINLGKEPMAIATLQVLIKGYQAGDLETSVSNVGNIVDEIDALSGNLEINDITTESELLTTEREKKSWRSVSLKAENFRGLTYYDGEEFFLNFDGKPFFLYGLNGSGKTSILSALTWCFTGMCIKERCEPDDEATCGIELFEISDATTLLINNWPFVVTVPHNKEPRELATLIPSCSVEVKLVEEKGQIVFAKRTVTEGATSTFEIFSNDGKKINKDELRIHDLDLELSLLMPARIMNIKFEPGSKISKNLISVAGLDALLDLGGMTRRLSSSVAKYKTSEINKASELRKEAREFESTTKTDENQKIWIEIDRAFDDLHKKENESDDNYKVRILEKQIEMLTKKGEKEFKAISDKIGVTPKTHDERKELINDLRQAQIKIGESSEDWEPLKNWRLITEEMIQRTTDALKEKVNEISIDLNDQYSLWLENKKRKGLLKAKIIAANYCRETNNYGVCPVCEQKLPKNIVKELHSLAERRDKLIDNLKHHVRDLKEKLDSCIPAEIKDLSTSQTAIQQLRNILIQNVWGYIESLGKLRDEFGSMAKEMIDSLSEQEKIDKSKLFVKDDWDDNFIKNIEDLENFAIIYKEKLSIAGWIEENIHKIDIFLEDHIFKEPEAIKEIETESLISNLKRLETYAEQFQSIDRIRDSLVSASSKFSKADSHRVNAEKAGLVHQYLGKLKDLDKYANILLKNELDSVSGDMEEFYNDLYPADPIRLDKIALQKSRAGTKPDYRFRLKWTDELLVDAEPVANLGRIRALLWSFAFALIKKYDPVLKTIIIDDPVISLDDYHAQNMVEDIIAQKLAGKYQPIVTIHQEHLLHERWGRDPYEKNIGFAKVLARDANHRNCRIQPSWEPLTNAVNIFNNDRDKWDNVITQARIALENHLKALAPYLTITDTSSETIDSIITILKQVRDGKKNTTSISQHVNVGKLINLYEKDMPKIILHIGLHGGEDRSILNPHDADQIVKEYQKWRKEIKLRYIEVEKALIRKTSKPSVLIDTLTKPEQIKNVLIKLKLDNSIPEIGQVAAEGDFTVFTEDFAEMKSFELPSLYFGILTGQGCRPLAWEGQIVLFAENLRIKDGDIALIQTKDNNYFRRVYQTPIDHETEAGWTGVTINPTLSKIKPEYFRSEDILLYKFFGVLFPRESERIAYAKLPGGEVVSHPGTWPNVLKSLKKNKFYLVRVKGISAEPLALDGQYLIIEKTDGIDESLNMMPCCVVLDDNRSLFKRFCFSVESKNRILLQPFNVAEPHSVIEAILSQETDDNDFETNNLPVLEQLFLVRGVISDSL